MSMSGKLSSRIPQPNFRRASASAAMETVNIDPASLKRLNDSYDTAISRSTANRSDSGIGSSASSRRKNSLQRNHSMYERTESSSTKTITFRQQNIIIEREDSSPKEISKLPTKKSGLNPLSKYIPFYTF